MPNNSEMVPFKVASHILEDLGLTLYTSLARVLVEFVANAYDADAALAEIAYDASAIEIERKAMRDEHNAQRTRSGGESTESLDERVLPERFDITITDNGHGMSRSDLVDKFLIAGRRRLEEEPECNGRSPGGRPLMGRKGLGKLAGFGVAKLIEVTSRAKNQASATRITLDFDKIIDQKLTDQIQVPIKELICGGDLPKTGGTCIRLAKLLHAPTKNRPDTIISELAEHFFMISDAEFQIKFNSKVVRPSGRKLAFAWPEPSRPLTELVEHSLSPEDGDTYTFKYRLRFTEERQALRASQRGVRVYSHGRLCASPSLLDADTNMHGFRMTDYLDGVVHADFIAEQRSDYIATDRQGLRWESPLLQPLHQFLSEQIKEACTKYQEHRDAKSTKVVKDDDFTRRTISEAGLAGRDERMAYRIAALLNQVCKQGVGDQDYKAKLPILVQGIGHGNILSAITKLAIEPNPDLQQLVVEITRLTHDEMSRFMSTVKGRLRAIEALRKVVTDVNFKTANNEADIQELLEESPWIIDPTFTQFLSADQTKRTLFDRLSKELGIGEHAPQRSAGDDERPDLTFILGSESLQRLVIVELKSANTPLIGKHLDQLELYMEDAKMWLKQNDRQMKVEGILVGSRQSPNSSSKGARMLRIREADQAAAMWSVRDYLELLEHTEAAHKELLSIYAELSERDQLD